MKVYHVTCPGEYAYVFDDLREAIDWLAMEIDAENHDWCTWADEIPREQFEAIPDAI